MVNDLIIGAGVKDRKLIEAMRKVPRHLFVEEALAAKAYSNFSLPIGGGQTISQPIMVAFMTEALEIQQDDSVLEIGTGSGYQTAILANLCRRVYTIERIQFLGVKARKLLTQLGYYNVIARICDGTLGWPEKMLFDAIIVTAGSPIVPEPLMGQLADGGRLVIPVGDRETQKLLRLKREGQKIIKKETRECAFVKLIGDHGWRD